MIFCNDVNGLFESYEIIFCNDVNDLFESYENISVVLEATNYNFHQWNICGDFKIIGMLLGM